MVSVCPAVLADNPHTFRQQMERVSGFATRVHIDLADGRLAPSRTVDMAQVWWPGGVRADLHVMYRRPFEHIGLYKALAPQLVIVHAEAEGDYAAFAREMHRHGIETGLALLANTPVEAVAAGLELVDHVLIFSGRLGYFGGRADMRLTAKIAALRRLKPGLEIGWDGGVDMDNVAQLAEAGIDVLNVGGAVQRASDPAAAYARLVLSANPGRPQ